MFRRYAGWTDALGTVQARFDTAPLPPGRYRVTVAVETVAGVVVAGVVGTPVSGLLASAAAGAASTAARASAAASAIVRRRPLGIGPI